MWKSGVGRLCHICMLPVVCWGLVRLVRIHLNPPVQAAGERHPTDLKTASVKSNALHGRLWKHLKLLTQEQ